MNAAILSNGESSKASARPELIHQLREKFDNVYSFGIQGGSISGFYSKETSQFIPIVASRNNRNPIVEVASIFSVSKKVKENKVDSAIIYGVKNHAAMAIGAKFGGAKKIICVINGSGNLFRINGIRGKVLRFISFPMLRIAYRLSSSICFQNSDDKELFIKKRLIKDNEKVFITGGSGVNLCKFPLQPLAKENRFLFLARITPSKGIEEYIKAATIVKQQYNDAIFDIVGPLDSMVENTENDMLQNAINSGVVQYHGATNDVSGWMGKCRVFVYPSYYPEGVPRCAIQAIASGRPIITCSTPGCKETVIDKVNGFMIPAKDINKLVDSMIWMIEHPEAVDDMAMKSRKYAEEKFDVNVVNEKLISELLK